MKKIVLLIFMTCSSVISYAQLYVGISGGPTFTKFSKFDYLYDLAYAGYTGYNINVPVIFKLDKNVSFQSGLNYMSIGSKRVYNKDFFNMYYPVFSYDAYSDYYSEYKLQYISIPLTLKYTVTFSRFGLYGRTGGYFSYLLQAKKEDKPENYSGELKNISNTDIGVVIGGGCQMNTGRGYVFIDAVYMLGLHDLKLSLNSSCYNRGTILSAGYMISLGKKE